MNFPDDLKYHREHAWLKIDGDTATIGITDFAQSELGEIVFVDLPDVGKTFKQDEIFGTIEALKTVSDLFMPLSGEVIEINTPLWQSPTFVNDDPYGYGWVIKIKILDKLEVDKLLSKEGYIILIG